ncbi:MAG: cation diffusion facilitator family transporter [Vulcanimicrobiota bacterium]
MHNQAGQRKQSAALLSIVSNSTLVLGKLVIGVLCNSVAVISEAVHSASDLMASVIAYAAVRMSDSPPDEDHPYGHGKIESISSLAEALLIFAAALYIVYEAILKLRKPPEASPPLYLAMGVMATSVVVNFFISRYLRRVGRETDSLALLADAEHLNVDVVTAAGVLVGLALAQATGKSWLDPVAALGVAVLIFKTAWELCVEALQPLMDARLPLDEENLIRRVLNGDPRVLGYHKLRTRKAGSQRHVDVHVQLDDEITLLEAHQVSEDLEDEIRKLLPMLLINIHIEPYLAEMQHQLEVHGLKPEELNQKQYPSEELVESR